MTREKSKKSRRLLAQVLFWPTFLWNLFLGRVLKIRRWWDRVDEGIWLGARPLRRDVGTLRSLGIQAVVNMCEEYPGPTDLYEKKGIEQLWLPTIDFQPPSVETIDQGVEFVQRMRKLDHGVYVHCKAGRARSATIILCWLVKYQGLSLEEAQERLLNARPHVNSKLKYRRSVIEYCQRLTENVGPTSGSSSE